MKQSVAAALVAALWVSGGCGDGTDLRITGANRAAQSLSSLKGLWDGIQSGNASVAQNAVIELARLPGGLAAMLLRPIDLPTTGGSTRTLGAAASFPACATLSSANGCDTADLSAGCTAGGVTVSGTGRRCEAASCAGGKVYSGSLSASIGSGGASGTLGLQLNDLCVTAASASGGLTATVQLTVPGISSSDFTLRATIVNLRYDGALPVAGQINVEGTGTFVGGPLAGCVTVEWSGANVAIRRVSDTTCTGN